VEADVTALARRMTLLGEWLSRTTHIPPKPGALILAGLYVSWLCFLFGRAIA
jgi:hypothetical protein